MGIYQYEGDFLISPRFEDADPFFEGLAAVVENGKWGFIDRDGAFVIPPQFEYSRLVPTKRGFSEGLAGVRKDGKFGYIDPHEAYVIAPTLTRAGKFRDGLVEVCDS